jgi:glycosyltransferase involved in cell wall biosynthesis
MKVLHINFSDLTGGAAIASYRLHQGLLAQNIDSKMLVELQKSSSSRVDTIPRKRNSENLISRFAWRLGLNNLHLLSTFNIPNHPFYQETDILNFHNLHGDYFNYLAIPQLTRNKPAVWTLHDMWSFTGHCAYSYNCDRWKNGCGNCPYLDTVPSTGRDNTRLEWKLKNWAYHNSKLTIITLSRWLTELAKQSFLKDLPIYHIPNGIDTFAYQPIDPQQCRAVLGISPEKKVLMFVAQGLNDPRKGGQKLLQLLDELPVTLKKELVLITLGDGGENQAEIAGISNLNLGYVGGDRLKSIAYSAADLFIFPTRADNLPLVLQESMACGTPMISFNIGGVPDLVRPEITGYLVEPDDWQAFRDKILQLLEDKDQHQKMSKHCREIAIKEYSIERQVQKYKEIYQQLT